MIRNIILSFLFLFTCGCATIVNGSNQIVPISSSPMGATVVIDSQIVLTTPCQASLRRDREHILQFSLEGYSPTNFYITRVSSGAGYGNIAFGGLIGAGIDCATGANYKLVPASVYVALSPD